MFSVLYLGNIIVKRGLQSVWAILTLCPWCCTSHGQYLKLDFPSAHSSFQWPIHVAFFYYLPWVSIAVSTWFLWLHYIVWKRVDSSNMALHYAASLPSNPWNIEIINHVWYYFFWFILCSVRESIIWFWRYHSIFTILINEVIESFTLYMWYKIQVQHMLCFLSKWSTICLIF